MRIPDRLRDALFGAHAQTLEEETYPRDAMGRPDLKRFTKPLTHYTQYIDDYLASFATAREAAEQSFAYRKGVVGQWGVIACGPANGLPYVLQLLKHPVPEGRSTAAGILGAWDDNPTLVPHLLDVLATETDIETLSTVMSLLGRMKVHAALPRLAELLRAPNSDEGDLSWSVVEAVSAIARKRFASMPDPKRAADEWLRSQGY